MRIPWRTVPRAILLAASLPDAVAAQVVRGSAFDALLSRAPLAGAQVWTATARVTTRTDSAGRFELVLPAPGEHVIVLHHPLLDEMRLPAPRTRVRVAEGDTVAVALDLPDADGMARLLCGDAIAPGSVMVLGQLLDGGDVVRDPASRVIVRTSRRGTRGGRTTDGAVYAQRTMMGAGRHAGGCPPRYFLNGQPTPFAATLEPMIDVERIEVYIALGTTPEQYRGWGAGCGVVLVWSR